MAIKASASITLSHTVNGKDSLTITISSSAGMTFKNTNISTTLTAHVFKGSTELTSAQISALGTLIWRKEGQSASVGTGATLTVNDASATALNYYCSLEA